MELTEKEKKILEILEKQGELATTKISFLSTINLYSAEEYLNNLEKIGLIERIEKGSYTYWKIKNENNINNEQ